MRRVSRSARTTGALAVGAALLVVASAYRIGQGFGSGSSDIESARWFRKACAVPIEHLRLIRRGFDPKRSADVLMLEAKPNAFGLDQHAGPWDYLQEVPLVFYGPGIVQPRGSIRPRARVTLADVAPTIADLLGTPWPDDRSGSTLDGIFVPEARRPSPRVVLHVVWDAGGWNTLRKWPDAWPHLRRMMADGVSVQGVDVGSSPSVTPPIHATIGTGTFPKQHGISDIPLRVGDRVVDSYAGVSARYLKLPTLGDVYDRARANRPKVGLISHYPWHMGMMGHGSAHPGGDKDILVLTGKAPPALTTNRDFYRLPRYVNRVPQPDAASTDISDGKRDGLWRGHDVLDDPVKTLDTPAGTYYNTRLLKTILTREDFGNDEVADLFFINYMQIDHAGHNWNVLRPEMRATLEHADAALNDITRFLDREVGKDRWVIVFTADHGTQPSPRPSGGWPIRMSYLKQDLAAHLGVGVGPLFQRSRPSGLWFDRRVLDERGITLEEIADFLVDYKTEDNFNPGEEREFASIADRRLMAAAWPRRHFNEVWRCALRRR